MNNDYTPYDYARDAHTVTADARQAHQDALYRVFGYQVDLDPEDRLLVPENDIHPSQH